MAFTIYRQLNAMDCGPTCLRMMANYYGRHFRLETLRNLSGFGKNGVSLLNISQAAQKIGLESAGIKINAEQLFSEVNQPCIAHWNQNHFVVIIGKKGKKIRVADPAIGLVTYDLPQLKEHFNAAVQSTGEEGIVLLLEPTPAFFAMKPEKSDTAGWFFLLKYIRQYKQYFFRLIMCLLLTSAIQLVFPFLTQSIVDIGINTQNLQFINIILIAQFTLFFSRTIVDFIRNRILLYLSTMVSISLLSNFWVKLMSLPIAYFDTKLRGDIVQRIEDQKRIETFITGSTLNVLFSVINLVIFSIVLLIYNIYIFLIFWVCSFLYFGWITIFLRRRRSLDYKRFFAASKENSATMELINGMQEIKLNNAEKSQRWKWEGFQASLFRLNFSSLSLSQYQQAGALFINEGKNIIITFFVARTVLHGHLTLGAMIAIQYIIGQLNGPIEQLIGFIQQAQDAKMSMERLNEIHQLEEEEQAKAARLTELDENKSIYLSKLDFGYSNDSNQLVLKNINLVIPEGKMTAIVGVSGSGKTTLLKLLLKFYTNYQGRINVGRQDLNQISTPFWRGHCASVLQDFYIFDDSILRNIALNEEDPAMEKVMQACHIANLTSFIDSLPLGLHTKIGAEGNGISQGQKQRILIARAVYKDPEYIFFDEATNALDTTNELIIMNNLREFFKGKTVVVVAHRLSTVKNANNILVLHEGEIAERGTHAQLTARKGYYYNLVRDQLELETEEPSYDKRSENE